jgi:hypothetical protein
MTDPTRRSTAEDALTLALLDPDREVPEPQRDTTRYNVDWKRDDSRD